MVGSRPCLIVVGGLPGSGKTTVARVYAGRTGTAFLRIDAIEQAVVDHTVLEQPLGPVGYAVGYALAAEQLRLGADAVAECVNPLAVTRDAWRRTAVAADAALVDVEIVCSDVDEHRRRVEGRTTDVPGLRLPTWRQVCDREYEPWRRGRLVLDTARSDPDVCAVAIADAVRRAR